MILFCLRTLRCLYVTLIGSYFRWHLVRSFSVYGEVLNRSCALHGSVGHVLSLSKWKLYIAANSPIRNISESLQALFIISCSELGEKAPAERLGLLGLVVSIAKIKEYQLVASHRCTSSTIIAPISFAHTE